MSLVVVAIAAAHALPPILGAIKSERGLLIGVIISVLIALVSGNPVFFVMDLFGVALGTWIGLSILKKQSNQ